MLNPSDIVISARGTVGAIAQLTKAMAFNQSCYGLRNRQESINDYIYYLKGRTVYALLEELSELRRRYWGCHLWGRGYFCNTVSAVTEDIIKKYIEDQNDEDSAFKIWDEKKDSSSLGLSSDT
jgi:hypothetical protein